MTAVNAKTHGVKALKQYLLKAGKTENKALQTAIKVQGFKLRKRLQQAIRQGAPGGEKFAPLTFIRRKTGRTTKPMRRLALAVRYRVADKDPFDFRIGWTGPGVSKKWKYLAETLQAGFTKRVTEKQRRFFRQLGGQMTKRSKIRKYLFLKKTTTHMTTPARPILDPFWRVHEDRSWREIKKNYRRKLAGKRI